MIIRSKAPLRISFAGGGTDLESYSNVYGGAVLNATVSMYAYCTIAPDSSGKIKIYAADNRNDVEMDAAPSIDLDGDKLILHRGVYNRVVKEFNGGKPISFTMSTSNDAPVGSGLGTSSTMIVAILEAFRRLLGVQLDNYELAQLAYDIERNDLHLAGGKQDQYSAVFGGLNLMEFLKGGGVKVNRLDLDDNQIKEFEYSILLYYGGRSRKSANVQLELTRNIIKNQISNTKSGVNATIAALNALKKSAYDLRDRLVAGDRDGFCAIMRESWENKKRTSSIISNPELERDIEYAFSSGAEAVKVTGAGGGGFLMLLCNPMYRQRLIDAMKTLDGSLYSVKLSKNGVESWSVK